MTKEQKHLQSIKPVERTIWVSSGYNADLSKWSKSMNLGRKKAKRELVASSLLKNPKKLNIKLRA